ncbi:hypothetical protein roselon_03142 [Roseibacterium elongatum DSM 19469]|uniref:Uncharacterized protein n=1 Tax=Roseicyclus elongatus DSM 19469 TaxID=1294273 RepID=W8S8Z2_9RHOB|nr:divergent polysaccharide deacetylase family protein [Roseibacterium elongatum]AHM05411.1 hypothetical protein roselon_03142 [Roseibacterium elongatum DSM 19469]
MGGGIIRGVIWGGLVAVVVAGAVSLSTPLPERGARTAVAPATGAPEVGDSSPVGLGRTTDAEPETGTQTTDAEGTSGLGEAASPTIGPDADPVAEGETTALAPEPSGADDGVQAPATAAEGASSGPATAIPLPAGSEFNRPPPEEAAALPETDTAPQATTPRAPAEPGGTVPQALDTAPAPQPDIAVSPTPPVPAALAAIDMDAPDLGGGDPQPGVAATGPGPLQTQGPETAPSPETAPAPVPDATEPVAGDDDGPPPTAPADTAPAPEVATAPAPVLDDDTPLPPVRRLVPPQGAAPLGLVTEDDLAVPGGPMPPAAPQPAPQPGGAEMQTAEDPAAPAPPRSLRVGAPGALPQVAAPDRPDATVEGADPAAEADMPDAADAAQAGALARYAVPFDAQGDERPLIAVVLIDDPEAGLDIATLTRFSFPVAFAIDPLRADAASRAAAFRAAGFEVLILGGGLPAGATPQDVEVALAEANRAVPEAIALLDTPDSRIQSDRPVLDAAVGHVAGRGQGMLAFARGLNAAEQTALRADVPAVTLFRLLDDEDQRATVITRYLGRAEFAAQQEGAVVVAGRTRPDTVTALFSWALSGRNEGVAIAPVSEVLRRALSE